MQDEAATAAVARALARALTHAKFTLHLHGDLGAGKTTFTRYLLQAWGISGRIKSPTYTLVEEYALPDGRLAMHLDLYRFSSADEWTDAGLDELENKDVLLIVEWANRAQDLIAMPDLTCHLTTPTELSRNLQFNAYTDPGREALAKLASL